MFNNEDEFVEKVCIHEIKHFMLKIEFVIS